MLKKSGFITLVILLFSCASPAADSLLYSEYERYRDTLTVDNLSSSAHRFFAPDLLKGVDLSDGMVQSQLLFKNYMLTETDVYENMTDTTACLTVNGVTEQHEPAAFNIEYQKFDKGWLIAEVDIYFPEPGSELPQQARCPDAYR